MRHFKFEGQTAAVTKELAHPLVRVLVPTADPQAAFNHQQDPADTDWLDSGTITRTYQLGNSTAGLTVSEIEHWIERCGVPGINKRHLTIESSGLPDGQYFKLSAGEHYEVTVLEFQFEDQIFDEVLALITRAFGWADNDEVQLIGELQKLGAYWKMVNLKTELPLSPTHFSFIKVPAELFDLLDRLIESSPARAPIYYHLQLSLMCAAARWPEALELIKRLRQQQFKIKDLNTFEGFILFKQGRLKQSRQMLRREKQRTNAWYWLMAELLFQMAEWRQYIEVLKQFAKVEYQLRGGFDLYNSLILIADAYARLGEPRAALRALKRCIASNPHGSNEWITETAPELWWLPFKIGKIFESIRDEPDFIRLADNPFSHMHGWYTDAIAALTLIPPFIDDWDITSQFDRIEPRDLSKGENSIKELEDAYRALDRINCYPPFKEPYLLLRKAIILIKLEKFEKARDILESLIKELPEIELTARLLEVLRAKIATKDTKLKAEEHEVKNKDKI